MSFASLRLAQPLLDALASEGYETPTPIQAQAIGPILDGKDLMGCAQTGTGKTAAFSLPLIQRIMLDSHHVPHKREKRHVRALILSPTRELASQIGQSVRAYGGKTGVRYAVIFGGVGQGPQVDALRSGVDVLIATPGRLLDLIGQHLVDLNHVEIFVLDEADRMLDMGFIHDIRKVIAKLPEKRQNLMFSATMPAEIRKLADSFLHHPAYVEVTPVSSTTELVEQFVYHVKREDKPNLLAHLYHAEPMSRVLVFTRTKHGADRVARRLYQGGIHAEAIHGNKSQNARQRALSNFKAGRVTVLVATDIAARGIDVDCISHVVNYDIPNEPETYVHRIGRTGRAGAAGIALSFCDEHDERAYLRDIEKLIKRKIDVRHDAPKFEKVERKEHRDARTPHVVRAHQEARAHQRPHEPRVHQESRANHESRGRHESRGQQDSRTHRDAHRPLHAAKPHHPSKPAAHPHRSGNSHGASSSQKFSKHRKGKRSPGSFAKQTSRGR
jgi:ATP-dependent RNA helicase RhlE